jgi:nucleoside-diphosphate-sugar epimerase
MSRPHAYSIVKAQNLLDYKPKIDLEHGLRITQEWLQNNDI